MNRDRMRWTGILLALFLLLGLVGQGADLVAAAPPAAPGGTSVFINELHYDNSGADTGEGIEVAGPAGTDLSGWSLVLYNGSNGTVYNTVNLSGALPDQDNGFGTLAFFIAGIQNGAPDGVALVDNSSAVVQFLSYEGSFTAAAGPAAGMTSTDIGVAEGSSTPAGESLQLTGTGTVYEDFTWGGPVANTFNAVNSGQSFSGSGGGGGGGGGPVNVAISEIRIDQPGADNDEYFELAGDAGASLDGLTYLVIGDGAGGSGVIEAVVDLTGQSVGGSGFFVAAESTFSLGAADLTTNLNFENSDNVTHLLVRGFTGADGDDLDTDDDGVLDVAPWSEQVDCVALVETPGSGDQIYCSTTVGPDGNFVPAHSFTCSDGWHIGLYDPAGGDDTPGSPNACPGPAISISEIRIDQPGADNDEYFELAGDAGASLDGLTYLVIGDGAGGSGVIEAVVDLTGQSVGGSGFFVAAESTFSLGAADLTTNLNFENSDNVTHLLVRGFTGADGDDLDTDDDGVLDVAPWSEQVDCVALVETPGSGDQIYCSTTVGPDGNFVPGHVYLCQDGWRIGSFDVSAEDTPGEANACEAGGGFGACLDGTATLIHAIQGPGDFSPENGNTHVIEGVVVGDFQDTATELRGFFLQEEDSDVDADPLTSEGIFVFDNGFGVDVNPGDVVRVMGTVQEYETSSGSGVFLTELASVTQLEVCATGASVTASTPTMPVNDLGDWERYEGMLVTFPYELTVTENYNLGRYGQVDLSVNGRLFSPTQVASPGQPALDVQAENDRRRIILDDANTQQNRDPIVYPPPELTASNTLRTGDTVNGLTGVLDQRFSAYRIQPTQEVTFTHSNPRPADPPYVGGSLRVASFNVLNYFNGDGMGGGFPTSRGADTPEEFERQRTKIISAITNLDADVVGLMEIENDGYGPESAIQDLVNGLNDATAPGTYAFIDPGVPQIGSDEIAVGLIYKTATVSPVGSAAILDSSVDPRFVDTKNRPTLAQSFMENSTGEVFTVAVNHLKSKGSPCDDIGDPDQGDGQGNCNQTRTNAAMALVDWLSTDPTGSGDPDYLIIGDLNSYALEDPVTAIKDAGYTNLLEAYLGLESYSFVFRGQAGTLDHALSNPDLTEQVTGAAIWHINADEPRVLDYNEEYKSPDQINKLYAPDQYRASDHDPVLVGLNLDSTAYITIVKDARPDSRRNFRFYGDLGKFKLDDITPQDNDPYDSSITFAVEPGSYAVFEKVPRRWHLTDIVCDPAGAGAVDLANHGVTITVAPRRSVTCTFVNQKGSRVRVRKYYDLDGNGQRNWEPGLPGWEIRLYDSQGNLAASKVTNGWGKANFRNVKPDQYTVCEVMRDGWFNTQPGTVDPVYGQPCYSLDVGPAETWIVPFGNHNNPALVSGASGEPNTAGLRVQPDLDDDPDDANYEDDGTDVDEDLERPAISGSIYLPFVTR